MQTVPTTLPLNWRQITPPSIPVNPKPIVLAQAVAVIRGAGTAGVPAAVLRDAFHFMRRAISDGNPLPSELAAAGVMLRKVGKGYWYSIPDFL